MVEFLKFSEVTIAIALIFIVLIQNKNVSLSLSTMSSSMRETTKRGAEKVLQNTTIVLGILFILNSLALFLFSDNYTTNKEINLDNIGINTVNTSSGVNLKINNNTNSGTTNK